MTGDMGLCSTLVYLYALHDGGVLTQQGAYCYELVPAAMSWPRAERDCRMKGGQLVQVSSDIEQVC